MANTITCLLIVRADANPSDASFLWKKGNGSYEGSSKESGLSSAITLGLLQESFGTYYCFVTNDIGVGVPCEIDIQGIGVARNYSDTKVILIVAVIAAALVAVIIVATVVVACRRRKEPEKLAIPAPPDSNSKEDGGVTSNTGGSTVVHKWPLRPGVHVHVNGLNTLTGSDNKLHHQITGFSYGAKTSRSSSSSGSDWASNTSSNPELNSDTSDPSKRRLAPHPEQPGESAPPSSTSGSRPNSRQQRKKREGRGGRQSDTLLPTFYENVSGYPHPRPGSGTSQTLHPGLRPSSRGRGGSPGRGLDLAEVERQEAEYGNPVEAPIFSSLTAYQSLPRVEEQLASLRHQPHHPGYQPELSLPTRAYLRPVPPYGHPPPPPPPHLSLTQDILVPPRPPPQFDSYQQRGGGREDGY